MKDQHKKIKGYRDLSQEEIDLMNRVKDHAAKTKALLEEVQQLRDDACVRAFDGVPIERTDGLTDAQAAESDRCLRIAKEHLQTGQMWFVRSIALPDND